MVEAHQPAAWPTMHVGRQRLEDVEKWRTLAHSGSARRASPSQDEEPHDCVRWLCSARTSRNQLEHSVYSDWLVFLEYTVAAALGHEELARSAQSRANARVLYGDGSIGLSIIGEPPFKDAGAERQSFEDLLRRTEDRWRAQRGNPASAVRENVPLDFAMRLESGRPALSPDDGFVQVDETEAMQPWRNISRWRDECSPYAVLRSQQKSASLVIDRYYGRVFDFPLEENLGIYGITQAMPDTPGAKQADCYLRSPYRKVPGYQVSDLKELQAVLRATVITGDGSAPLFRGQAQRTGRNVKFLRKTSGDPKSVLYVFAPDQRYQMDHEQARPRTTGEGRPERQGAKFLITGWGHHRNSVARHLAMAVYLDPAGHFGTLPPARQLFPERGEDLFGDYLERALERGLPSELKKYVEQLYWVVDD